MISYCMYYLPCTGPGGTFPTNVSWPTCINPVPPPPPCVCLGDADMGAMTSSILLENFCRNVSMPGYLNPPSKKRCGTRNVANPTLDNFCYCDSVDAASGEVFFLYKIELVRCGKCYNILVHQTIQQYCPKLILRITMS